MEKRPRVQLFRFARRIAVAAILLGFPPALGREMEMVIETFPPGARVMEGARFVGLTGGKIRLDASAHMLTIELANHAKQSFTIAGSQTASGRFPEEGVMVLKPDSVAQWIKDQLGYRLGTVVSVLAAMILLLGVMAWTFRRAFEWRSWQRKLAGISLEDTARATTLIMQQVGDHRVLSLLGKGGMAEVYLAVPNTTLEDSKAVAIKILNKELRERPDQMKRFEREIVVSQELIHPGIVAVHEWGWHGDSMYLVMELVRGQELRKLLPSLAGDWPRIRDILSQLMMAVDHAHTRGVSHRDLKPENLMITDQGRVKVMDFGLARAVDSTTLTQAGTAMGTPRYIAPETVAGKGGDDRADQYSLGVIAYEMITGHPPFESDEVLYLLYAHSSLAPPAPSQLNPTLPPTVDGVLLQMLSKQPRERFRTVEEARVELLKALADL